MSGVRWHTIHLALQRNRASTLKLHWARKAKSTFASRGWPFNTSLGKDRARKPPTRRNEQREGHWAGAGLQRRG
eukprot:14882254-Alexandrium_andersonii.AAC.1